MQNIKTPYHRADYFIQNLNFNYFIEKKRWCVTEREREGEGSGRGHFSRPMEYFTGFIFIDYIFFNYISFQYLE
jgi:hypothetical protein